MNKELLSRIEKLKQKYIADGFIILGVFGSYARGDQTPNSDIDILYEISQDFFNKYPGWKAASAIEDIREDARKELGKKIDFADKNALKRVGKKYILSDLQYV